MKIGNLLKAIGVGSLTLVLMSCGDSSPSSNDSNFWDLGLPGGSLKLSTIDESRAVRVAAMAETTLNNLEINTSRYGFELMAELEGDMEPGEFDIQEEVSSHCLLSVFTEENVTASGQKTGQGSVRRFWSENSQKSERQLEEGEKIIDCPVEFTGQTLLSGRPSSKATTSSRTESESYSIALKPLSVLAQKDPVTYEEEIISPVESISVSSSGSLVEKKSISVYDSAVETMKGDVTIQVQYKDLGRTQNAQIRFIRRSQLTNRKVSDRRTLTWGRVVSAVVVTMGERQVFVESSTILNGDSDPETYLKINGNDYKINGKIVPAEGFRESTQQDPKPAEKTVPKNKEEVKEEVKVIEPEVVS